MVQYKTIIFDNSPLSRLIDESERDRNAILCGLKAFALLRITGMNVIESANIQDSTSRISKLRLLGEITGAVEPYQAPNDMLTEIANAWQHRRPLLLGDHTSWVAVKHPEEITDEVAAASRKWHVEREQYFRETYEELRQRYQPLFTAGKSSRPKNAADLMKYFIQHRESYYDILLLDIFERQTEHRPTNNEFSAFLDSRDGRGWSLFWLARVYAAYQRSIQQSGYGWKVNAGMHDLDSAVYLPYCDWFVTGDEPQRKAFRMLNALNRHHTIVVRYRDLRSRLLIA